MSRTELASPAARLAGAGDMVAEILGIAVAAHLDDVQLEPERTAAAQQAILQWHSVKAEELARESADCTYCDGLGLQFNVFGTPNRACAMCGGTGKATV